MGFTLCPNLIYYENICNRIGTDVGKTIASSIITESLQADYKPIQAGDLDNSDSKKYNVYQ
jgi:dethiobiotin synthetase